MKTRASRTLSFYPMYKKWCCLHNFPILEEQNTPQYIYITYNDQNTPIYCCFLWNTDSRMCIIGYPVSNPEVEYKEKEGGLEHLFQTIKENIAGIYDLIWTTSATPRIIEVLEKVGFELGDQNVNHYICKV